MARKATAKTAKTHTQRRAEASAIDDKTFILKSHWMFQGPDVGMPPTEIAVAREMTPQLAEALQSENVQLGNELKLLRTQYDKLATKHAYLLRDSATNLKVLALYRNQAADDIQATTTQGLLRVAT